jgi:hypothetical protein
MGKMRNAECGMRKICNGYYAENICGIKVRNDGYYAE